MDARVLWSSAEAAAVTAGRATRDWQATGVAIDSRAVAAGDLFVALKGERVDGHDFAAAALAQGAAACVVDHRPAGLPADAPLLEVADTMAALVALGRAARMRCRARIVAVTGSVGKTGTKEALALALATHGATYASTGNLNNQIGVPLALARMPRDAAYAVFELGMNHAGEIAALSALVRPDIAVITNVEPVHLEFFGTLEAIADAKAEIFASTAKAGTAVLNIDNPMFERLVEHCGARGLRRILSFGAGEHAYARLIDCSLHPTVSAVTAEIGGERLDYCLPVPGRHWVINSLAVLAVARAAGADLAAAAASLSRLKPIKGRGERHRVVLPGGGAFEVIDDAYNASPPAMRAALAVLGNMKPGAGGRRIAVLGDMLELGPQADALHHELAPHLLEAGVDLVFACGKHMRALFEALPARLRGAHAANAAALLPRAVGAVRAGDVVLVKGSLGSRMAPLVAALRAVADPQVRAANGN